MIGVGERAPALAGQPVFGLPFNLDTAVGRGAVVVVFFGALSAGATVDTLARLTRIWPRLDAEQGGLVAVTRSPLETARDFVPRHHVLFPVLVDETGESTGRWGVGRATGLGAFVARAQPNLVRRAVSVVRNGQPLPEAHVDQAPAAFVVDRAGLVQLAWYGRGVNEKVDEEALWAAASR